jgi:hypothetical protein
MRVFKGLFFFLVAFIAACIILLTFMQPEFLKPVPAKLLWYQTQAIPVYYFLIGAFVIGLLFGLVVFLYYWGSLSMSLSEQKRTVRERDQEIEALRLTLKGAEPKPANSSGDASSQPAVPEKDD